jgi:hypothetical protein
MTRREHRQLHRSIEHRVLAGEGKLAIVGQAAADGQDWQRIARWLALIPTPASRRRYRWPNRALICLLALAEFGEIAAALSYGDRSFWLILDFVWPVFLLVAISGVARFRVYGYNGAAAFAVIRGGWWVIAVAMRQEVSLPAALVYAQIALLVAIAVLATVTERLLLPKTRWTDGRPRTDAAGNLLFEE